MSKSVTVEYGGFVWRRYPHSKRRGDREYFKRTPANGKPIYLHRQVWIDCNGDIPSGYHVHHIDEDCQNNDPENLEIMCGRKHISNHGKERWLEGDNTAMLEHLERIRPLTKAWHASPEGIEKHREIGAMSYEQFVPTPKPCKQCDTEFLPKKIGNTDLFCSNNCKSAWRRASGVDDIIATCLFCENKFKANKYRVPETCGRSCANRLRHARKTN